MLIYFCRKFTENFENILETILRNLVLIRENFGENSRKLLNPEKVTGIIFYAQN